MAGEKRLGSWALGVSVLAGVLASGACLSSAPAGVVGSRPDGPAVAGLTREERVAQHRFGGWYCVLPEEPATRALDEACALEREGRLEEALGTLDAAQRRYPRCSAILEARGALYAAMGFQRAAAGDFQRAVWVSPRRASAWAALGRVRVELRLYRQALVALERARELGLTSPELSLWMARAYRGLDRRGRAAECYGEALATLPEPTLELTVEAASLATERGGDILEAEALEHALKLLGRTVQSDQPSSQAWFVRSLLLEASGEEPTTVAAYLRALDIDPQDVAAWARIALLSLRLGDPETAGAAVSEALAQETDPDRRRALEAWLARSR